MSYYFPLVAGGTCLLGYNLYISYQKIYALSKAVQISKGYAFDDPSVSPMAVQAGGLIGSLTIGSALFVGQVSLYSKILSFETPSMRAQYNFSFRVPPPPLTLSVLYTHLGPSGTRASGRCFFRKYGIVSVSAATAAVVCTLVCAHVQPIIESQFVPFKKGDVNDTAS